MSTTVTLKRMVNTFVVNNTRYYILVEKTYESNVYPHTPRTASYFVGELPLCIQQIFRFAAAVEGGCLNNPPRDMTPERYIKSWINALKNPVPIDTATPLIMTCWGNEEYEKNLKTTLARLNLEPVVNSLPALFDPASDGFGFDFCIPHTFSDDGVNIGGSMPDKNLGYKPLKKSAPFTILRLTAHLPFSHDYYYLDTDANGHGLSKPQWSYAVISDLIRSIYNVELSYPGVYKTLIPQYRESVMTTPTADPKLVTITLEPDAVKNSKTIAEIAQEYGTVFTMDQIDPEKAYYVYNGASKIVVAPEALSQFVFKS